eukprot:8423006-Pyramimonas_sp.AAC.2
MGETPGRSTACRRQCCKGSRGQTAMARNPVEGATVAEAKATPAEDVAPARDGDDDTLDIPGASPPT